MYIALFAVFFFDYIIFDNYESWILPVIFLLFTSIKILDFVLTEIRIKRGNYVKIGHLIKSFYNSIYPLIFGIILIFGGVIIKNNTYSWRGVNFLIFMGIGYILSVLLVFRKFPILIKKDRIYLNNQNKRSVEWKYAYIDKIEFFNNKVKIYNNPDSMSVELNESEIDSLISYLPDDVKKRIVFEGKQD